MFERVARLYAPRFTDPWRCSIAKGWSGGGRGANQLYTSVEGRAKPIGPHRQAQRFLGAASHISRNQAGRATFLELRLLGSMLRATWTVEALDRAFAEFLEPCCPEGLSDACVGAWRSRLKLMATRITGGSAAQETLPLLLRGEVGVVNHAHVAHLAPSSRSAPRSGKVSRNHSQRVDLSQQPQRCRARGLLVRQRYLNVMKDLGRHASTGFTQQPKMRRRSCSARATKQRLPASALIAHFAAW